MRLYVQMDAFLYGKMGVVAIRTTCIRLCVDGLCICVCMCMCKWIIIIIIIILFPNIALGMSRMLWQPLQRQQQH
ncbi:hypothetical protein BDB00DRAFT_812019 [Zychaea mexicana]|uniref:uncharacterized protein n=1 Tax=Zychaea mexicana TaxID=64656 RepID=UPI0022FED415|nr:uncharacterized protein BDB00DRAFT_812019 [Zychaea mexicana]KAI9495817.1 hypothetical protein BDB00DRAFT_812019 [Zychaea mexicana]